MIKSKNGPENFDKIYIPDTSVWIDEPDLIYDLTNDLNIVCVPWMVHKELTSSKRDPLVSKRAQRALKNINEYRKNNNPFLMLVNVNWEGIQHYKPAGILEKNNADDEIMATCLSVFKKDFAKNKKVILLTHDLGMQIKARELKFDGSIQGCLQIQEWNQDIGDTAEQLMMKIVEIPKSLARDKNYKERIPIPMIEGGESLLENSGVMIRVMDDQKPYISHAARRKGDYLYLLDQEKSLIGIQQRPFAENGFLTPNWEQIHGIHSLDDLNIAYNTLIGPAGTGKTILAIALGLHYSIKSNRQFRKIYITRAPISVGSTLGFLPGDIDDKMNPWVLGMLDNVNRIKELNPGMSKQISFLLDGVSLDEAMEETLEKEKTDEAKKEKQKSGINLKSNGRKNEVGERKRIEIISMEHIRGRSIENSVIIMDEVQNMKWEEVKTFATRLGEGTKLIMTGDPSQIDNSFLTAERNGLVKFTQIMKGDETFAHTYFTRAVRSRAVRALLKRIENQR